MRYQEVDEDIRHAIDNVKKGQKFYRVHDGEDREHYPTEVSWEEGELRLFQFRGSVLDEAYENCFYTATVIAKNLPLALTAFKKQDKCWGNAIEEIDEYPLKDGLVDIYLGHEIA